MPRRRTSSSLTRSNRPDSVQVQYERRWSQALGRDMEFKVYGHAGKGCVVFPTQSGRFWDFEDRGMVNTLRGFIDAGRLMLFCVDSNDDESWSAEGADAWWRIDRQNAYFSYITDELAPLASGWGEVQGPLLATGCSMGGLHAALAHVRRPDLFDTSLSISGVLDSKLFFGDWQPDPVRENSPVDLLWSMADDDTRLHQLRAGRMVACIGQGRWEDELLPSNHRMAEVIERRGLNGWVDFWGHDVDHDWPWWHRMMPYHLAKLLG